MQAGPDGPVPRPVVGARLHLTPEASCQSKLTDDTSRTMYGVELGVRWTPVVWLAVEGGWWYRDWSVDDGPATYDGPFLRVAFGF